MLINNKNIGYSEEVKVLGSIVAVNLLDETVTLMDENEELHTVAMSGVIELQEVGSLDEIYIYEGDVLKVTETGKLYEVVVLEDDKIAMALLNNKLERVEGAQGSAQDRSVLTSLQGVVELQGSIHELRNEVKTVDFNLAVFRKFVGGEVTYFYAGNDKVKGEVDLIKVLFLGHHIIEEEAYERTTFSHEQFLEMVESGLLKEVNPMEVANYVAGLTHGKPSAPMVTDDVSSLDYDDSENEDKEDDTEYCEECDYPEDECECELW